MVDVLFQACERCSRALILGFSVGGTEIVIFLEIWKTTRVQDETPKVDDEDEKLTMKIQKYV